MSPVRAAVIEGTRPLTCAALTSAQAAIRVSTMARLVFWPARLSALTPWSSAAFTSARLNVAAPPGIMGP